MTRVLLYPVRQRCRKCRRFFGPLVVDGLYDSWECAGRTPPEQESESWPREHFRWSVPWWQGRQSKVEKAAFETEAEALAEPNKTAYVCSYCHKWHRATLRT